jgi:hypothetical protein
MIRSIDIRNFRCFERLHVESFSRLNVIVGDNGAGKTALLEAIFLPLSTSTQIPLRYRQHRGLDGTFSGPAIRIEEAIFGDLFYQYNYRQPIQIVLDGDGVDTRSLTISRGPTELLIPLSDADKLNAGSVAPITFAWKDAGGFERRVSPSVTTAGLQLPETGEDMPDFFLFPSNQTVSALENATRFSDLSKSGHQGRFVELFTREYPWLTSISVELIGGSPALFASVKGNPIKLPLANVSGGINRICGILLAIASRPRSVVLVDEIEAGIYFKHQTEIWRAILAFMREYDSQLFVTTHSEECLRALRDAINGKVDDISLWRMERDAHEPVLRRFSGAAFKAALEMGGEIR